MQLYYKPPGHLPGRVFFKGKRFAGLLACALVSIIALLPVQTLNAESLESVSKNSVTEKAVTKNSVTKKSVTKNASKNTASKKSSNKKSTSKQSANKKASSKKAVSKQSERFHPRHNTYMKREWGVEVMFVRVTSAGYMLEFRYKVLDAEKAKPLFERQTKPHLTHLRTGATLIVPTPAKTGALRNSNPPKAGKVYWMFFANPRKLVKVGEKVNIDIGDFHANGLVVQK